MENGHLYDILKQIVERYVSRTAGSAVLAESSLDDLGIDSPRRIDILMDTEDRFHISIQENQFEHVRTFRDLVDLVSEISTSSSV